MRSLLTPGMICGIYAALNLGQTEYYYSLKSEHGVRTERFEVKTYLATLRARF